MDKEKLKEKFLSTYSDYFNNFTNMLSEAGIETEMGDVQKVEKNFVVNPEEIDLLFNAFNELDEWMPSCLGKSLYEEICYYEIHKDFIMPPSLVIGIKQNDLHVVFSLCLVYNPFDYTPVIVATINYPDSRAYSNQFNFMELGKELANGKDGFKNCVRWISRLFIK